MSTHLKSYVPENGFDFLQMSTKPVLLANYTACMLSFFQCLYLIEQAAPGQMSVMLNQLDSFNLETTGKNNEQQETIKFIVMPALSV